MDINNTENSLLADNAPASRQEMLQRIHAQLGHRSLSLIRKYVKQDLIKLNDFPNNVSDSEIKALPLCESCQIAKFTSIRRRGRAVGALFRRPAISQKGHSADTSSCSMRSVASQTIPHASSANQRDLNTTFAVNSRPVWSSGALRRVLFASQ